MEFTCAPMSLDEFEGINTSDYAHLDWRCPFSLPFWLCSWNSIAGKNVTPLIVGAYRGKKLVGLAPLQIQDDQAFFFGSESVFDFQEVIFEHSASPAEYRAILKEILHYLQQLKIRVLSLGALSSDSPLLRFLPEVCRSMGLSYSAEETGQMAMLDLPSDWDGYLSLLSSKQRHEVRRKLRRLNEAYQYQYDFIDGSSEIDEDMDNFFHLFRKSRKDKAYFLDEQMEKYFQHLASSLAYHGQLHIGRLSLNGNPAAFVFGFHHRDTFYLYNNGYDPVYGALSVGALAKVLCIRHCMKMGVARFNFLKGDERYKVHLGGIPESLYRARIEL